MRNRKNLGNQGFSLIELIVVVTIIVIATAAFTIGISAVTNKSVVQCAKKLQIALESNRTTTMGKKSASVSFYLDSDGNVYAKETVNGVAENAVQIGNNSVVVTYVLGSGTTAENKNLNTTAFAIEFERASGSLKPDTTSGKYVSEFIVTNTSGSKTLHVKIDKLTGRVSVE